MDYFAGVTDKRHGLLDGYASACHSCDHRDAGAVEAEVWKADTLKEKMPVFRGHRGEGASRFAFWVLCLQGSKERFESWVNFRCEFVGLTVATFGDESDSIIIQIDSVPRH